MIRISALISRGRNQKQSVERQHSTAVWAPCCLTSHTMTAHHITAENSWAFSRFCRSHSALPFFLPTSGAWKRIWSHTAKFSVSVSFNPHQTETPESPLQLNDAIGLSYGHKVVNWFKAALADCSATLGQHQKKTPAKTARHNHPIKLIWTSLPTETKVV